MNTGERIEALRIAKGWSLTELSVQASVGKGGLSEIERGMKSPTEITLRKLAKTLEVPPGKLLE